MQKQYGATLAEWVHFSDVLGLQSDLLPAVADPSAVISKNSTIKGVGKTPCKYNAQGEVVGIAHWTAIHASDSQIDQWSKNGKYSICLQTRSVRAIDIDCDDLGTVSKIRARVAQLLQMQLPARGRAGSPRVVLACVVPGEFNKRIVRLRGGGALEVLGNGQQFIAAGTHPSGGRYQWEGGLPGEIPECSSASLERLIDELKEEFGLDAEGEGSSVPEPAGQTKPAGLTGPKKRARAKRGLAQGERGDPVVQWLEQRGWSRGEGRHGECLIHCPFEHEHTGDSGVTETVYYPAGTNGYETGHFKCLHAHCAHRSDAVFLNAVGYQKSFLDEIQEIDDDRSEVVAVAGRTGLAARVDVRERGARAAGLSGVGLGVLGGGADIPDDPTALWSSPIPGEGLTRDRKGWLATIDNVCKALRTPGWHVRLGYDAFRGEVMHADWRASEAQWASWGDEDYTRARIELEKSGFAPVGRELIRDAVSLVARECEFDSAQVWLDRLKWDGVPRVDAFWSRYAGAVDSEYTRAVGAYYWTLAAGRVLSPGVKGDMVPILVGKGGVGKTRLVAALAPGDEYATRIDLSNPDADMARKLRGRLVAEIAELRGLHTKGSEAIKDFISATKDEWVPKYREFATSVLRRFTLIGTTDKEEFLSDDAGNERRWLPMRVGDLAGVDIDAVVRDREQLWAEGAERYMMGGVHWQDADRLAAAEHGEYAMLDSWEEMVEEWMESPVMDELSTGPGRAKGETWKAFGFTSREALQWGVGCTPTSINRGMEMRMSKILARLGLQREKGGRGREGRNLRIWRGEGVGSPT